MSLGLTIGELADWIIANRKKAAFRNYSWEKIAEEIIHCIQHNTFDYSLDEDGKFNGVICGEVNAEDKTFMVYDILTTDKGIVKKFMKTFMDVYPGYTLTGNIRNRKRIFNNPAKLEKRLT